MKRAFILIMVGAALAVQAQDTATNAVRGLDWPSFQAMARKNIFDPTRVGGRRTGAARRQPAVDAFTFGGTSFEGTNQVAFFYGFNAPKKEVKAGDAINGYTVGAITFNSVELKAATGNPVVLHPGGHMKREDNGPWSASEEALPAPDATPVADGTNSSAIPSASSGSESDIIKRLRAKREQEDK